MSRVYNVLTGAPRPSGSTTTVDSPDHEVWVTEEETPFVEIGAPGGPVFSAAQLVPRPIPEAKIEAKPELNRSFPRLVSAPTPAYLYVRFHDLAARSGAKIVNEGPDHSLVAFHVPDHPISGEYRTLRDEISKQLPDLTSRVLMFNSIAPQAGNTSVLLNLAITLAHEGKNRVLVVDANLNRPAIAAKLAAKPSPGLYEALTQQVPLAWVLQPSQVSGLNVLTAGEVSDGTPGSVCRDLPRLLTQLRKWSDWVLVDAGIWGKMPDCDASCHAADAVYLVAREGDTERPEFVGARGWVKELGGLLRGYITTRATS